LSSHKREVSIRIVYLCPNGYLGGAEKFVIDTCVGHKKYGHINPTILFFSDGSAVKLARELGINCIVLKNSFRLSKPRSLFKALKEIRELFLRFNWNIYHATMAYSQIIGALATVGMNVRKVWYQHGPVAQKLDLIASCFSVDKILFNSKYTQKLHHTAPSLNYPNHGEQVISPGIENISFDSKVVSTIEKEFKRDGMLLLMAGRITPFKQYEIAIESLHLLFTINPSLKSKVRMIIVGGVGRAEDEKYHDRIKMMITDLKLESSVFLLGSKSNMSDYYKACDLVIHIPMSPEPFGLVVAEAMNYGRLVMAPSTGGTQNLLIPYQTGINIDCTIKDLKSRLTYQLLSIIEMHFIAAPKLERIKSDAQKNIQQNFSMKKTVITLESCYKSLL